MENTQLELELPPTIEELNEVLGFEQPRLSDGSFNLKAANGQTYLFEVKGPEVMVYRQIKDSPLLWSSCTREAARALWRDLRDGNT